MLTAITPETEADPVAVLLGWLTCFGSVVGRGSFVRVGADRHYPALFAAVVGKTSDAKGVAWGVSKWPFSQADPAWASACVCPGVGSGQGLIERVRDDRTTLDRKTGEVKTIPGAKDKRCLLRLDELAVCFKLQRSESSTLGETLLTAWGGEPLEVPNRGDNALSATGYAVSVLGDTQPERLRKLLESGSAVEAANGWLNRFLWVAVRSERDLPGGGNIDVLAPFLPRLKDALAFGKEAGEVKRDAAADALWHEVYGTLKRSGDSVPHTDRVRPQVVRLSLLYALADRSTAIRAEHLKAALAVWDFCRGSAALCFGSGLPAYGRQAEPDPLWLMLLNAINLEPGIKRSDLTLRYKNTHKADAIGDALDHLAGGGLAHPVMVQPPGGGRPAECWYPGAKPGGEGTEGYRTEGGGHPSPRSRQPGAGRK
jgi:hypothetical protein